MILLKFATAINGESTVTGHDKWINIDSVQLGVGRSITMVGGGGDRETSNPSFSEVTMTKSQDVASTDTTFGFQIPTKCAGVPDEEAIVSSYSMSSGGDRPSESFSLNFTKISYQYDKFDGDKITTGTAKKWNLEKNETY